MGLLRTVALGILGISGLTFVALFGRLPIFRYYDKCKNFSFYESNWPAGKHPSVSSTRSFGNMSQMAYLTSTTACCVVVLHSVVTGPANTYGTRTIH